MGGDPGTRRLKLDMHVHTRASFDSLNDPAAVVQRALALGFDRICVTDHNETSAALELKAAFPDHVIVGEEVKTAERVDIIGLYIRERVPKGTPARETCERIRAQGGLVYVPHPFAGGKGGGGRLLETIEDLVDIVEGFNARIHSPRLNARAQEWARARGLPVGAGSDAHTLREVGRGWVELPPFDDEPAALLAALRSARIGGVLSSHAVHLASTWARIRKKVS
jgi:predicted metal-dependent phosphoesterase TrpH